MILCCGDVLIDMLPVDLGDGRRTFAPHAGGAVFNTAIALGRLGVETGFFNGLSTDLFGRMLADELKASGVDHSLCPRSGRPTTLAFVTLEDGHAHYHFYDEATASRLLESAELPVLDGNVRALFFGGISLVVEPSGERLAKAVVIELDHVGGLGPSNEMTDFQRQRERSRIALHSCRTVCNREIHWMLRHCQDLEERAGSWRRAADAVIEHLRQPGGSHLGGVALTHVLRELLQDEWAPFGLLHDRVDESVGLARS